MKSGDRMSSVTQRIKEIKQPRGGYLKVSEFEVNEINDGKILNEEENIHASVIGMVVDYMTRFMMGTNVKDAFKISILGSQRAEILGRKGASKEIQNYIDEIQSLDDNSIINACKAVTFDVWFRNPMAAAKAKGARETTPNKETIENIRTLVERSLSFWKEYGPIEVDGFTFENGGYTKIVDSGDGDFLTKDTLWDFKVSSSNPTSDHTLQLLMYYIMGKHSNKKEFENITKIGIFNPRLNKVYIKNIYDISDEIIDEVSNDVIGYGTEKNTKEKTVQSRRLEMPEIMKALGCTRYKVIKMYAEQDLPLKKEKNKYYIEAIDLIEWVEEQKRLEKQRMIYSTIFAIVMIVVMIIMFMILIP